MLAAVDLEAYRAEAESFSTAIGREFLLHLSGRKDDLELEPIYEAHAGLFERAAVEWLREAGLLALAEFAVEGLIGRETKDEAEELARLEAALEIEVDGERIPFRRSAVDQANEPDPDRREAISDARLELEEERLAPLRRGMLERSHALGRDLGWRSEREMFEELTGIDLGALHRDTAAFLEATEASYEPAVEPRMREQLGFGFDRVRRSDLPAFFRAPTLDPAFPAERLLPSFESTFDGMGIDPADRVVLDVESRPKKSPRAFCSAVRVPDEVHLVITPVGGHEDFEALFHEAGHAMHYAHVDRSLAFEHRYLGDNSVTEGFAFLLEHLTADPAWLSERAGVEDPEPVAAQARTRKLVFLRRYAAKLAYELELHSEDVDLDSLPERYSRHLSAAVHVDWPRAGWLADVDPFFYAARYLRAWALETHLARSLRKRFGERWFAQPEAGEFLRRLWARGQEIGAEELLAEAGGGELSLVAMAEELAGAPAPAR